MTRNELKKLTKKKLLTLAAGHGIKTTDSLKKDELIELFLKNVKTGKVKIKQAKTKTASKKPAPAPKIETTEALIEASKFYEGPTSPPSTTEDPTLPASYQRNLLAMVVRDPYWGYAYWELTAEHIEANRNRLADPPSARMILRIYQVGDNGVELNDVIRQWDIELVGNPNNWYIHLGTADCHYLAEIGLLDNRGVFVPLARSNTIQTPRDTMSDVIDDEWLLVEEDFEKIYHLSGGFDCNRSSAGITELLAKRWRFDVSSGGVSSLSQGNKSAFKKH